VAAPRFLPGWDEAQQAIESALSAWRNAPDPLPASFDSDAVIFVDKQRKPGQRLSRFEILGHSDAETARQFTVRLHLEPGESPQLVRYKVFGRNPVWVFRLEDFEAISHWEMDMSEALPQLEPRPETTTSHGRGGVEQRVR
jgi:hypothetical protein